MGFVLKDCEQKVIDIDAGDAIEVILQHVEEKIQKKLPRSINMSISIVPGNKIIISVITDVTNSAISFREVH